MAGRCAPYARWNFAGLRGRVALLPSPGHERLQPPPEVSALHVRAYFRAFHRLAEDAVKDVDRGAKLDARVSRVERLRKGSYGLFGELNEAFFSKLAGVLAPRGASRHVRRSRVDALPG
jgi:hypothetical protein